jgi:CBS domain-containing protein
MITTTTIICILVLLLAKLAWDNKKYRQCIRRISRAALHDQNRLQGEITRKDMLIAKMRGAK